MSLAALAHAGSSVSQIALHSLDFSTDESKPDTTAPGDVLKTPDTVSQHTEPSDNFLVVSPYLTQPHLLNLNAVSKPIQLLAKALTLLQPTRTDYATAPYLDSFNWTAVMETLQGLRQVDLDYRWESQAFYVIVFRSQIPPSTDRSYLGMLDQLSHTEAMESGGLLKYWYGVPDENGRNLATCIWRAREDASSGAMGAGHAQAMRETRKLYLEWKVERLKLIVGENALDWEITQWQD
ncbi:hypothetical protein MMC30_000947 [Trapelia coarctata]|nr:hypothetical protein [Trapelia coarctata]